MEPYILIVDDDEAVLDMLNDMVTFAGWQTKTASRGAECLSIVEEHRPGLIILDLMMPVMSGFEVLTNLKRNPATRDIPVIINSALGNDQRLTRLGVDIVLQKGQLDYKSFIKNIEVYLGTPQQASAG